MKIRLFLSCLAAVFFIASGAEAKPQTKDCKWCTVTVEDSWSAGEPLVVRVTPKKGIPDGMKVACDLHWLKVNGWGGVMGHYTPPQDAVPGKTVTFRKKPDVKEGLDRMDVYVFLAPDGDFKRKVNDCHTTVKYTGGAAAAAPGQKPAASSYPAAPSGITWKKSYILIGPCAKPVTKGGKLVLPVKYHLDASETWGPKPTQIKVMPLGPWIDNPDGSINTKRQHVGYQGLHPISREVQPGDGAVDFEWTVGQTYRYNSMFFLAKFVSPDGKDWPWDTRGGSADIVAENTTFRLEAAAAGGLFRYDEPPVLNIVWGCPPRAGNANLVVRDINGAKVLEKSVTLDATRKEQPIVLSGLAKRGVFSATLSVPDVGDNYTFFGTIPRFERKEGKRTPFGATDISSPELSELAANMGFTYVRHFIGWGGLEPGRGVWNLVSLDARIDANSGAGLKPWISLQGAPTWALPAGMHGFGFEPAPVDMRAWGEAVTKLSQRYKGKLFGWEWLNEIVPGGKCTDPVATYLEMCKTGTTAAKAVDPSLVIQLAGGLWPHNFRVDLLNAGVAEWIDILPVHYSDYAGVVGARDDLVSRGIERKVAVADNESAAGMSVWKMDAAQTLSYSRKQCLHVMTRWPDVLCAGARFVTYFGGTPQAAGNWTYLLDAKTPRPVAATLAVVQNKLAYAKPMGKFFYKGGTFWLFEDNGKAVLFACASNAGKSNLSVAVPGAGRVTITDFQGNETRDADGSAVALSDMPVIIEGADLSMLKMHAAFSAGASEVPVPEPQIVSDAEGSVKVAARVRNLWNEPKTFNLEVAASAWSKKSTLAVSLKPGERKIVELTLDPADGAKPAASTKLSLRCSVPGVQAVDKAFTLYALDPRASGNLLSNGAFEDGAAAPWKGHGTLVSAPVPGRQGNHALSLKGAGKGQYRSSWQGTDFPVPGATYIYSAWVWGRGMGGGSNIAEHKSDGSTKNYYIPNVFSVGAQGSASWRLLVKRLPVSEIAKSGTFTPVAEGPSGDVLYDNIMLTLDKGRDYVAFAGAKKGSEIPLLCENQIAATGDYKWTPANLAGVAEFTWDKDALHLRVDVNDDTMSVAPVVSSSGEETLAGDSLALCIFPRMGVDGPENDQLRWYLSKASPGGGSGACTLFRPTAFSHGAKSGQLAKDSSVYSISIERSGNATVYDLRIPWSEIPGFTPSRGATFGCTLVLFDSDGKKGSSGRMTWGGGLKTTSLDCGLVTLE